ncbi:MAG: LysR substrate-binding domain-containing protein [Paracoccaceae bacterium]|nr:LysR substrate-binding domain-containing protein [Paracoccaceae bacterium]MDG1739704.1 LysR substrate-binding domain-containing protein [Paracoccaceae bacterium]MDG2258724.1 LysR substrate-binding domain-containing protein [Paracoccaceae bacterium]
MRRLPNLNQIKAFEAAARHLSFKHAAAELFVSDAAIGHQIKALEEALGVTLFRRLTRRVELTKAGAAYLPRLTAALDEIEAVTSEITEVQEKGVLKLTAAPFYTNRIVLPNLVKFRALYPEIDVKIVFEDEVVDFAKSDIEGGLRYGDGNWPGVTSVFLHGDMVSPVCAPSYVKGRKLPLEPADIAELLLGLGGSGDQDWMDWFNAADHQLKAAPNIIEYTNRARMFDLALSGNGVVLGDLKLIESDLEKGHLVQLHPLAIPRDRSMYLVYPDSEKPNPRIAKFGGWLSDLLSKDDLGG